MAIPVLIHDMRKLRFHTKYTDWIANKITNKETVLAFDNFVFQPFEVKHGLDQGCNLSPFNYNCYSVDQMKALKGRKDKLENMYADDGVCAVRAHSLEEVGKAIVEVFNGEKGLKEWGRSHHSL